MSDGDGSRSSGAGERRATETVAERANRRICAMFDACREAGTAAATRDAALLSVLYGADVGRRRALSLQRSAFEAGTGRLNVGRRTVHAVEGAREALADWVELRGDGPGPLFCPVRDGEPVPGRRLSPGDVDAALDRWSRSAGLDGYRTRALRELYRSPWWRGSCPG